jgi:hypothetical protein
MSLRGWFRSSELCSWCGAQVYKLSFEHGEYKGLFFAQGIGAADKVMPAQWGGNLTGTTKTTRGPRCRRSLIL